MLQAGKSITKIDDPLVKIQPDYLFHAVKNPKPEVASSIRQLRKVYAIDENRYRQLKKQLPYITCGIFNPPYRRTENFGWINHFMLDIDHLTQKDLFPDKVKALISKDKRVKMAFISPGEDGLKILFALKEKCYDPACFSLFYKVFTKAFSETYHLQQVIDQRTSDVTRACFISHDPDVYYNPDSEEINMTAFVDFSSPLSVLEIKSEIGREEKTVKMEKTGEPPPGPDDEAMAVIKSRLNPSFKVKREKIIFVPAEIERTVAQIIEHLQRNTIETREVINIHYGKKFRLRLGLHEAEINVFYGKRGFSVVQTPRHGTNSELNTICAQLISELIV